MDDYELIEVALIAAETEPNPATSMLITMLLTRIKELREA